MKTPATCVGVGAAELSLLKETVREKIGKNLVYIGNNKYRSQDGKWHYRAMPGNVSNNHVHLKRIVPKTGKVIENWRYYLPRGGSR